MNNKLILALFLATNSLNAMESGDNAVPKGAPSAPGLSRLFHTSKKKHLNHPLEALEIQRDTAMYNAQQAKFAYKKVAAEQAGSLSATKAGGGKLVTIAAFTLGAVAGVGFALLGVKFKKEDVKNFVQGLKD